MPERTPDHRGVWQYLTGYPGADLKANPTVVQLPKLVEAVGLDGRFLGAIRPFPGMADETVHGVPEPDGTTTITSLNNILFAKYVSIDKGLTGDTFKGIAYIADNPAGDNQAIYFAYRDSSDGSSDVVMLEDFESWTDFKITTLIDYDITSSGKYIYLCVSASTTSIVSHYQNEEPPYNKAYFWDFKINEWDDYTANSFQGRFAGLMPKRLLGAPLNEIDDGTFGQDSIDVFDSQIYGPAGHLTPVGVYTYALELISRKHNLRSWIRFGTTDQTISVNSALRYYVNSIRVPRNGSGTVQQLKANISEQTCIIDWSIPHVDGFRFWRSLRDGSGDDIDDYTLKAVYLVSSYEEKGQLETGSDLLSLTFDHDSIIGTIFGSNKTPWINDGGLVIQSRYDVNQDEVGPMPRLKRLAAYDGALIGITDVREPLAPDKSFEVGDRIVEAIAWSTLVANEPENFPSANLYKPEDAAEKFYALEPVGDHLAAISNQSIYKLSRSGDTLVINRLQFRLGGVSRYGQTSIGSTLFVVTPSGVKQVNMNNGQVSSVTSMDRVILDDNEWAGTLADVHMEYDALIGALILLNTSKGEAYIMWESTGAITKIEDVPWTFLVGGPDVLTDGPYRAYFITNTAQVHVIDGARAMGKRSMCGVTVSETMNGTATSGSTATTLFDTAATFPANCVGFKVHILSGTRIHEAGTIGTRVSDTELTISGLSGTLSTGDRYSVAPVVSRITLPQVVSQGGQVDHFVRKTVTSMSASFINLAGHTGSSDTNGKFNFGVKKNNSIVGRTEVDFSAVADATAARVSFHGLQLYPFLEFKGGDQDWELQGVMVKGILGVSESESRRG